MIHSYKRVGRLVRSSVSNLGFKQAFSVAVALVISLGAFAQDVVSGKVTDSKDGSAIPGVSVTVKGTTKGAQSDMNGTYKVNAASGSTLVFTFVGYIKKEVKATGSVVNVSLAADNQSLEEVVVVGYGTTKRKDLTGSVEKLNIKDLRKHFEVLIAQNLKNINKNKVSKYYKIAYTARSPKIIDNYIELYDKLIDYFSKDIDIVSKLKKHDLTGKEILN